MNLVHLHIFLLFFQDVVRKIESTETDRSDKPKKDVVIADSGAETIPEPYSVDKEDAKE